ncbi:MAG: hemerythrin family protein [Spirochaetia bacterium]|nr:hemerythrin family protein [Spirochaetia bacterium]
MHLVWQDSMSVKIDSIDEQHKELIEVINEALQAVISRKETSAILAAFEKIGAFAEKHFAYEEKLFTAFRYDQKEAHMAEHGRLRQGIRDISARLLEGRASTPEILGFLRGWLVNHILNADVKYSEFLRGHGIT